MLSVRAAVWADTATSAGHVFRRPHHKRLLVLLLSALEYFGNLAVSSYSHTASITRRTILLHMVRGRGGLSFQFVTDRGVGEINNSIIRAGRLFSHQKVFHVPSTLVIMAVVILLNTPVE